MSLNEHVQHACSNRKYNTTSGGNHLIDPSASFDLITESCMSPVYNNQLVQPLSGAKDSSMDTILAQQYEDCNSSWGELSVTACSIQLEEVIIDVVYKS